MFCKINVLRNFAKFTGKQLCQSLFFNKGAGLRPKACNVIRHRCFPENFAKFLRTPFFYRTPLVAASEQSTVAIFVGEICSSNNAVRCPDVFCYHLNGTRAPKNAPQKIIVTLFSIYISFM